MRESSVAGKNILKCTVTPSGTHGVEWYDWASFFAGMSRLIPKITSYNQFNFSQDTVGVVTCKEFADSDEVQHSILHPAKDLNIIASTMPQHIVSKGLDSARQWYLFEQVRQFCNSNLAKDLTCPKLTVPKPGTRAKMSSQV